MQWAQHPKDTRPVGSTACTTAGTPSKMGQRRAKEELKGFSPGDRNIPAAKGQLHPATTKEEGFQPPAPRTTCPVTSRTAPARPAEQGAQ